MSDAELKPGDVVMLATSGPLMTIVGIDRSVDLFRCAWFTGSILHEALFHPAALRLYVQDDSQDRGVDPRTVKWR